MDNLLGFMRRRTVKISVTLENPITTYYYTAKSLQDISALLGKLEWDRISEVKMKKWEEMKVTGRQNVVVID